MSFGLILLVLQIAFAVHVVRTGRPFMWLWLIIFVPGIGCLVYFLAELLPEIGGSRPARRAASRLGKAVNTGRDYQALIDAVEETPTADNRRALAQAMLARNNIDGALALYQSALVPPQDTDPVLMMGLARCQFLKGQAADALTTLDRLLAANPGYQSQEGHLLYARSLDEAGRVEEALAEYQALLPVFPGEEVRGRTAQLLQRQGRTAEARALYEQIIRAVERAGGRYRRDHRTWYDLAKREIGR